MHTTVRLSSRGKRNLEKLRSALSSRLGRRLTQQESMDLLLVRAERDAARLAAELAAPDFPLSEARIRQLHKMRRSFGGSVLKEGVDAVVYEG